MAHVKGVVRMIVPAGAAKPSPAIGQALGPLGVNMMDFCKNFNARTEGHKPDIPTPVVLTALVDRSFDFEVKTPQTSWLLKKTAGIEKGTSTPGHMFVGEIHVKQIYEIAKVKQRDQNMKKIPLEGICRSIIGQCRSLGLTVTTDKLPQDE